MLRTRLPLLACLALIAGVIVGSTGGVSGQATPAPSPEGLSLAASGLEHPRGFDWGPDGSLYIAEASITNPESFGATPVPAVPGAGLDGAISRVSGDAACPTVFQGNLPSSGGQGDADLGPESIVVQNGQVYLLDEGGGASHGNPLTPDGIYLIPGDGSAKVVADLGAWVSANPVTNPPASPDADGDLTAMVGTGDGFVVLESDLGQVLQVATDGTVTRLADLSDADARPAGLAVAPDGSILVGQGDRVVAIAADGSISESWTGLSDVDELAVGPDGTVYAAQRDGTVVRQTATDEARTVATGFTRPGGLAVGPDSDLYISSPATGGAAGHGSVVRIDLDFGQAPVMSDALLEGSSCLPTPPATATSAPSTPDGTGTPDGGATSTPDNGTTVTIDNFAFSPTTLTVSAGTTVTWVNNDTAAHTVTADDGSFDSGNIAPGESFTHTFDTAGSFSYHCTYHPNMVATIVAN